MEYNFTNLAPLNDYEELLAIVSERKKKLELKCSSLKRKQQTALDNLAEIEKSSEILVGDIESWQKIKDHSLSEQLRDDAVYNMAGLEYKLLMLRRRKQSYSAVFLICIELDIECVARQISGLNDFARKLEKHRREVEMREE
jgi:hypothetical protein